MKVISHRTTKR